MPRNRILIVIAALICAAASALAKTPDAMASLELSLRNNPAVTETVITGAPIKRQSLSVFRSVSVTGDRSLVPRLEQAVATDSSGALWRETVRRGGKLESAVYELPGSKIRRYLLYVNSFISGGNEAAIIYLEGEATPEKIKKLINTLTE